MISGGNHQKLWAPWDGTLRTRIQHFLFLLFAPRSQEDILVLRFCSWENINQTQTESHSTWWKACTPYKCQGNRKQERWGTVSDWRRLMVPNNKRQNTFQVWSCPRKKKTLIDAWSNPNGIYRLNDSVTLMLNHWFGWLYGDNVRKVFTFGGNTSWNLNINYILHKSLT